MLLNRIKIKKKVKLITIWLTHRQRNWRCIWKTLACTKKTGELYQLVYFKRVLTSKWKSGNISYFYIWHTMWLEKKKAHQFGRKQRVSNRDVAEDRRHLTESHRGEICSRGNIRSFSIAECPKRLGSLEGRARNDAGVPDTSDYCKPP